MSRKNVDFGKSFAKFASGVGIEMRNPMLLSKIQDRIMGISGIDFISDVYRAGAKKDIKITIENILSDWQDNSVVVIDTIGQETMDLIWRYKNDSK